jgi:tetratricopeptide (TPR) repeat protein
VARREGNDDLAAMLQSPVGMDRLRVVERLAGGHPRIWMLLAGCLSIETIDELVPLFLRSLDDLTPYYQERMKSLAPGHRAIVVSLCADGLVGALPVGEIARRSRIAERSAPQLIDQLVTKGFVRYVRADSVPGTGDGRVKYYELREPLHRLSVQMKRAKGGPLELVVRFLRNWYGADLVRAARGLSKSSIAYGYVNQALGDSDDLRQAGFFAGSADSLRERAAGLRDLRPEAEPFALLAEGLADLEDAEPSIAIATLERACAADPDSPNAPDALGRAFAKAERFDEAISSFETAIVRRSQALGVDHEDTMRSRYSLGQSQERPGNHDDAIDTYNSLIPDQTRTLGPDHPNLIWTRKVLAGELNESANLLNEGGDHRRAAEVCAEVASLKATFGLTLVESLLLANDFAEATKAFEAVSESAESADYIGSMSFLFDELAHHLVAKDPAPTVTWLVARHAEAGHLDALATGVTRGLTGFMKAANPEQLSRWAEAWHRAAQTHSQLLIASELMRAAAAWVADQNQQHLLALPPELREILVSIIEQVAVTKPAAKAKPASRPRKK